MKSVYGRSKLTGSVFKIKFEGENYVHGILIGKPECLGYSITLINEQWEPHIFWEVGDVVAYNGLPHDIIAIQDKDTFDLTRRWLVIAYRSDIPKIVRPNEVKPYEV